MKLQTLTSNMYIKEMWSYLTTQPCRLQKSWDKEPPLCVVPYRYIDQRDQVGQFDHCIKILVYLKLPSYTLLQLPSRLLSWFIVLFFTYSVICSTIHLVLHLSYIECLAWAGCQSSCCGQYILVKKADKSLPSRSLYSCGSNETYF